MSVALLLPTASMSASSNFNLSSSQSKNGENIPPQPELEISNDISDFFSNLMNSNKALGDKELGRLKNYNFLFVPGFMTRANLNPDLFLAPKCSNLKPKYFEKQILHLRNIGLNADMVNIGLTAGAVVSNSLIIKKAVMNSSKQVVLIAHSKGGSDVLDALIKYDSMHGKLHSVITLQSPFRGTPIVDYALKCKKFKKIAAGILERRGGDIESLIDLSVKKREAYMRLYDKEIKEVAGKVRIINVGTYIEDVPHEKDTVFEVLRNQMSKRGILNDGLVPLDSAFMPAPALHIKLSSLDHVCTVLTVRRPQFNKLKFMEALLHLVSGQK